MTQDLAAALLKDVPRFASPDGNLLAEEDVLAALSRALDPAIAERAGEEVAEFAKNAAIWEGYAGAPTCPTFSRGDARYWSERYAKAADLITALLAQNAWLKANVEAGDLVNGLEKNRAEAAEAREERLRGALEWYAKDGWNDRSLEPPTPEEVEVFGDNILDFPMPEIFFDRGERARAALTETATTEEGK